MSLSWELVVQAIVAVVIITDPITRGFFFAALTKGEPQNRVKYVRTIALTVAVVLFGAALVGKELLDVMGINLGAFGFIGGLIVAGMGLEMLAGGEPSRAQGGKAAHEEPESFEGSVIVPYAIPFVAGPGAITMVITIASSTGEAWGGTIAALIAVAVAVALLPLGHLLIANHVKLSDRAMSIATRFGGLIIATIGAQLMLNGLRTFYGF
jgi:multiple antibiotic resistance protein